MKKNFLGSMLLLAIAILGSSCSKESELENVTLYNPFDPDKNLNFFVVDSFKASQSPDVKIYFHTINTELIKDDSKIVKVGIFRSNNLLYTLPYPQSKYYILDFMATRYNTYQYKFAFIDVDGFTSTLSSPIIVYVP